MTMNLNSENRNRPMSNSNGIVRKMLPRELLLEMQVRDVERTERSSPAIMGTLYLTNFRLVFLPEDFSNESTIKVGNRYISQYDIPLASIYKIVFPPADTRSGFTSFLNENQIRSETRSFTIYTRDFRSVSFSKCSVTKSSTSLGRRGSTTTTNMENFIERLKEYSQLQFRGNLYPYSAMKSDLVLDKSPQTHRRYTVSGVNSARTIEDDLPDFSVSNDERIRSFLTFNDWNDELREAQEFDWIIDEKKFNDNNIIIKDGPIICLPRKDGFIIEDFIWHWSHTSDLVVDPRFPVSMNRERHVLVTALGINDLPTAADTLRRVAATDVMMMPISVSLNDQSFQRYHLGKFPCNLKRLQTAYEKLIEICLIEYDPDDERWLSKLNASKWLKYVSKALHGAASMAKLLDFKNIQLAGSETDNSCLLASLIQIILRPKCRTIKGFCELIVREWIIRGHRFLERLGHLSNNLSQEGPVFLLFLDCVHQLIVQNPFAFEFTDYFLLEIYHSTCYCYHHTFVFNQLRDRLELTKSRPKDVLILSTFDFTLYLMPEFCRLLRNEASLCHNQKEQPNRNMIDISQRPHVEQFEYDMIQAPQKYIEFTVDWRIVCLDFWSQCYTRYEPIPSMSIKEQQILKEIELLREKKRRTRTKSRRNLVFDPFHPIVHANSWHPLSLDTRF